MKLIMQKLCNSIFVKFAGIMGYIYLIPFIWFYIYYLTHKSSFHGMGAIVGLFIHGFLFFTSITLFSIGFILGIIFLAITVVNYITQLDKETKIIKKRNIYYIIFVLLGNILYIIIPIIFLFVTINLFIKGNL